MTTNSGMTAEQLATTYDISLNTISSNFPRTQQAIKKKYGVIVEKIGRGKNATYMIKDFDRTDPNRALTIYESKERNLIPMSSAVGLIDINFFIFIGIVSSPQQSFRGSYLDLLSYLEVKATMEDILEVKKALKELADRNLIMYIEDDSDPMYFMAGIKRKAEQTMELQIKTIQAFQRISEGTKRSWMTLMKVYIAIELSKQPCTAKNLAALTGLSEYQVRGAIKTMAEHNLLAKEVIRSHDFISDTYYCLGTQIDLNALEF